MIYATDIQLKWVNLEKDTRRKMEFCVFYYKLGDEDGHK